MCEITLCFIKVNIKRILKLGWDFSHPFFVFLDLQCVFCYYYNVIKISGENLCQN